MTLSPDKTALQESIIDMLNKFDEQLPYRCGALSSHSRVNFEKNREAIISSAATKFPSVVSGLARILRSISEMRLQSFHGQHELERNYIESQSTTLDTLNKCFTATCMESTFLEEDQVIRLLVNELLPFIESAPEGQTPSPLKMLASKALFSLSIHNYDVAYNRFFVKLNELATTPEENPDFTDVEIVQHLSIDSMRLTKLLNDILSRFKTLKKHIHGPLLTSIEKCIWNWLASFPEQFNFSMTGRAKNEELSDVCDRFFEQLDLFCENNNKRKASFWPLQMLLLLLSPKILEEVINADSGAPCSARHSRKRRFIDDVRKSLSGSSHGKQMTEAAAVTAIKLCRASTYVNSRDSSNYIFHLVQSVVGDLKALIFNPAKPFARNQATVLQDADLMTDCFVSLFRITPHSTDAIKVCLNPQSSSVYHYVLVCSLYKIVTQPRISWWPEIHMVYSKAPDLRAMFLDTLQKVSQTFTAHTPLKMIQSLSLKEKVNPLSKFKEKSSEEGLSQRTLLLWFVKLIHAEPKLFLSHPDKRPTEIPSSSSTSGTLSERSSVVLESQGSSILELTNGLVSLIHMPSVPEVAQEAMDALLVLHHPDNIELWNPTAPVQTFWDVSSQMIFSIGQKLVNHQIANYTEVLIWLKEILRSRNQFLERHKDNANLGSDLPVCKKAHITLEVVFFTYLWSVDIEAGLISMSSFALLCEEADIRCGQDDLTETYLVPNYQVYQELAHSSTMLTPGRAALQKRIMALLRKIEHMTQGVIQAWEDCYSCWQAVTNELSSFPRVKPSNESGQITDSLHRTISKRRTSHQSTDHEQEDQINEWTNMTGFLCSLGGVCLQRRSPSVTATVTATPFFVDRKTTMTSSGGETCLVTQFVNQMLRLLVCYNEKFVNQIQRHVKELASNELSPALIPLLFDQIKSFVDKFFDSQLQVMVSHESTQFTNHIIFIIKSILESKRENMTEHLGVTSIEPIMLSICRYIRHLDSKLIAVIQMRIKYCYLVVAMMNQREDLVFRQEMKFRNKLTEYVSEWVMGRSYLQQMQEQPVTPELLANLRDLDQAAMQAVSHLLRQLPLQPEESDSGDLMEAKSQLFLKYFSLFHNILNECSEPIIVDEDFIKGIPPFTRCPVSNTVELRTYTIQAMSNLLSANIDSGLVHSLALGYHRDLLTRAAFMEVLTTILQQGTEFEMLAETILHDRYEQLVQLVTMIGDKGELPIAMALANVITTSQMDELARVFVTLFDAKHLLPQLLWNIFFREVEGSDCMQTLLRGNSLGSKIMAFCFKIYGTSYLKSLLEPSIRTLTQQEDILDVSYEVDPTRVSESEDIDRNRDNLMKLTQVVFDAITDSTEQFPPQLRSMCHCLYEVLNTRFPSVNSNLSAVGTVIFLRFINPAIVSPYELGVIEKQPSQKSRRGLMLMSKILQNIANHVEFSKEQHMLCFNDFLKSNFEKGRLWVTQITSDCASLEHQTGYNSSFISDANVLALHRLLWNHQEKMGDYLSSSRDHKAVGRRPFDKMATLLAYLGPPENKNISESHWTSMEMMSTKFEEIMSKHNMHEKDEFKSIKSLNIFYKAGTSKAGNPVFYYIARRFINGETNGDLLIYHVIMTLKPFCHKPFEVVLDFTHCNAENRFRQEFLQKWFVVLPEPAYDKIASCYIYNCNSWVREFTKCHESTLNSLKYNKKLIFLDSLQRLNDYIDPSEQRLPQPTIALEEDLKVYPGATRLHHKESKVTFKIGASSISVTTLEKSKVLGQQAILNDVYFASEIEEVCLVDENQFTLGLSHESGHLSFIHPDCDTIVTNVIRIRSLWELSQSDVSTVHTKMRPKDVPGTLLNMALLNLGSSDASLRTAAYNLLRCVIQTFDLKIEETLPENPNEIQVDLDDPDQNNDFIRRISEQLAVNAFHLTLEFLEECIRGFRNSELDQKSLCLEYMTPWLPNLTRFRKHPDHQKQKQRLNNILDKLDTLTMEESKMYAIQAKIWGKITQISEILSLNLEKDTCSLSHP